MDLIKLLNIASSKQIKKTINDIITETNDLGANFTNLSNELTDAEGDIINLQEDVAALQTESTKHVAKKKTTNFVESQSGPITATLETTVENPVMVGSSPQHTISMGAKYDTNQNASSQKHTAAEVSITKDNTHAMSAYISASDTTGGLLATKYSQVKVQADSVELGVTDFSTLKVVQLAITKDGIKKKVSTSGTETSYDIATTKDLQDACDDLVEKIEGKTFSFSASYVSNPAFNSNEEAISVPVSTTFVDILNRSVAGSDLKLGDVVYVIETGVPDRWVSAITNGNIIFNKMEVSPIDLSVYQLKLSADNKLPVAYVSGLHAVATSGDYDDLENKPTIPTVPTNVSAFTNDAGYLTEHQSIAGKADKVSSATSGNFAGLDANGNLTDSGKKASDFLTEHQSLANYLAKDNSTSYTPSGNYNPATKKYVDDAINTETTKVRIVNDAGTSMQTNNFKGYVKLSQPQYQTLKTTGTLTVGGETLTFSPLDTNYVTPAAADVVKQNYVGNWTSGTDYAINDVVAYNVSNSTIGYFIALDDIDNSTSAPNVDTTNWKKILEVPVSGGTQLYQHIVYGTIILTSSATPFTTATLCAWLYNNGFTSASNTYTTMFHTVTPITVTDPDKIRLPKGLYSSNGISGFVCNKDVTFTANTSTGVVSFTVTDANAGISVGTGDDKVIPV